MKLLSVCNFMEHAVCFGGLAFFLLLSGVNLMFPFHLPKVAFGEFISNGRSSHYSYAQTPSCARGNV